MTNVDSSVILFVWVNTIMLFKPGPMMDAKIARRLWRAVVFVDTEGGSSHLIQEGDYAKVPLPGYSTDLDESHRVVRFMQSKGFAARFQHNPEVNLYFGYFANNPDAVYKWSQADTMPMVICVAALAALDGSNMLR